MGGRGERGGGDGWEEGTEEKKKEGIESETSGRLVMCGNF